MFILFKLHDEFRTIVSVSVFSIGYDIVLLIWLFSVVHLIDGFRLLIIVFVSFGFLPLLELTKLTSIYKPDAYV